jgi:hypothetical protein
LPADVARVEGDLGTKRALARVPEEQIARHAAILADAWGQRCFAEQRRLVDAM